MVRRRIGIWGLVFFGVLHGPAHGVDVTTEVPGTRLQAVGEDLPKTTVSCRRVIPLSGTWLLQAEASTRPGALATTDPLRPLFANPSPATREAIPVQVPGVWQTQGLGMDYHGTAVYRREFLAPEMRPGERAWLHVENAAGRAEVRLNGRLLGTHTGAWTPFELDLTDALTTDNQLAIRVTEAPEHFTSGFLKHVSSSFGGLWGDVWIEVRPEAFIEDVFVVPDVERRIAQARVTVRRPEALPAVAVIQAGVRSAGEEETSETVSASASDLDVSGTLSLDVPVENGRLWSPDCPHLYEMEVRIVSGGAVIDEQTVRFGMREVRAEGGRLLLNGTPLFWAGILHWGVYPEYLAPACTREEFRAEIRRLKASGFNGICVGRVLFPERYYEVADAEGILIWQKYPLWLNYPGARRPESAADRAALVAEYAEMFRRDRRHPCVVLRTLSGEDSRADRELMRGLYELCRGMIPGALVQGHCADLKQEFADFLDVHPDVKIVAFQDKLAGWMDVVRSRGGKPLFFGEGPGFDTFPDVPDLAASYGEARPWWADERYGRSLLNPAGPGDFRRHEEKVRVLIKERGPEAVTAIVRNSCEHAFAARKYLTELSRLSGGLAGQSLTALRDVGGTRSGIFDDFGHLKWTEKELCRLNAQSLPLISPDRQSRCYNAGETMTVELFLSHFGPEEVRGEPMRCRLLRDGKVLAVHRTEPFTARPGGVTLAGWWSVVLPPVEKPVTLQLVLEMDGGRRNSWPLWVFPKIRPGSASAPVVHDPEGKLRHLGLKRFSTGPDVMVASRLDAIAEDHLRGGGNVLLIDPEGRAFPSHETPFWREVAVERASRDLFAAFPWTGAVDLQFYSLGTGKAYDAVSGPATRSLFRTINCRTLQQNDLVVEKRYGNGLLVATVLNFGGEDNVAGEYLLDRLLHHLVIHTSR